MRRAKIVATIGHPRDPELRRLHARMDEAKLNFSHEAPERHRSLIADIRRVSEELARPVAFVKDSQGVISRTRGQASLQKQYSVKALQQPQPGVDSTRPVAAGFSEERS